MAKATIICGTADMRGVTSSMCESVANHLRLKGVEVVVIRPSEMTIGHCRDCGGCSGGKCIIEDDMAGILDSFSSSDILILASPIHFSGPSSLIKTVMDRFQPLWYVKRKSPKYCLSLLCGGSEEPNFDITEKIVRAFSISNGMQYMGGLRISGTDSGVENLDDKVESFLLRADMGL